MKTFRFSILTLLFSLNVFAIGEQPMTPPKSQTLQNKVYKCTILAYMNGYETVVDPVVEQLINKMEKVGSDDSLAIVAEWGSLKTGKTKRLFIEKDNDESKVSSTVLSESTADMGQAKTLTDFLLWGAAHYPSEKIIVVLGGHGSGWSGISYDQRHNSRISTPELGNVFNQLAQLRGVKTDLVVFDSCLMSMIEVATEISNYANLMAGAMDKLPDDVWVPYDLVFEEFKKSLSQDPKTIGTIFVDKYYEITKDLQHSDGILGIQFGVTDLSKMDEIQTTTKAFVSELLKMSSVDLQSLAKQTSVQSQKYYFQHYVDLTEWLSHIPQTLQTTKLMTLSKQLQAQLKVASIYQAKTSYYPLASGLTVSLVPEKMQNWVTKYQALSWSQKTNWDQFLRLLDIPLNKKTERLEQTVLEMMQ